MSSVVDAEGTAAAVTVAPVMASAGVSLHAPILGAMQRWPDAIYDYIERLTRFDDPLLREMEARAGQINFPIVGPQIGPWLYFFARLTGARRIFELGSGFGYSTWFFASA